MAAGNGDLNNPAAQALGHTLWQQAAKGHYIVDDVKFFHTLVDLSAYLQVTQVQLRLKMHKADLNSARQFRVNRHIIRFNKNDGYLAFLNPKN